MMDNDAVHKALETRSINHVAVLGANGTMGFGSAALFTHAVPKVTFLARTEDKAKDGLASAIKQVRSDSVANRSACAGYDDLESVVADADIIFEAVAEDPEIKKPLFERVDAARRDDSIVATVSSGLSINGLCADRSESFRKNFCGLHFFNPPNVITGTELIPNSETDPAVMDFLEAFSRVKLGREIIRTFDTPAFAGNRVGFKVLNEAAQLAEAYSPLVVDSIIGPYTGRALTPLATIDLVGWDVHRAIVDNICDKTTDEAIDTLKLPTYMAEMMEKGVLGDKTGGGFFKKGDEGRMVLDTPSGLYEAADSIAMPDMGHVEPIVKAYAEGRYSEGMDAMVHADGDAAKLTRKVVAGYISYAFHRVGEVCETIDDIDRIMATGFNWAPPTLLVDTMGAANAVKIMEEASVPVPTVIGDAAKAGDAPAFFAQKRLNPGRYFVAAA